MEYSLNLCFVGFECKRSKFSKKRREKLIKAEKLRHNLKITSRVMPQQEMICHNKEEAELKLEVKIVAIFHKFVAT